MSIYFIRSSGLIKIGYSQDVRRRVGQVIANQLGGGEYLGYMAGDRIVERHLHDRFAAHRQFGEWFRVNDDLIQLIGIVADPGYPDSEKRDPKSVLRQMDEKMVERCSTFISEYFTGLRKTPATTEVLAGTLGMSVARLDAIYAGVVDHVSAGEFLCLSVAAEGQREEVA